MVNIIQSQSNVSYPTQMPVDGGANCHALWDKHLFYVLFVRQTSLYIAGGSTLSASGVVLSPTTFPDYLTIHSLAPAY